MATTPITIYTGQPGTTDTVLKTAGNNIKIRILAATVVNDSTTPTWITFNRVPSGSAVGDANLVINQKVIGSQESRSLWELLGKVLQSGDSLTAKSEIIDQLTVDISGVQIT